MRPTFLLAAALAGCAAGCGGGPKVAPVTGTVTHKGQPLTAGSIVFHPAAGNGWAGEPPSSVLQMDGRFTMKTYPHGEGVPPGSYQVTLVPALAARVGRPEYGDPKRTPWTIEVPDAGVKDKPFEVK
ncbi:MAG: hypothetical protein ACRC33_09645 [Gemmataceae bacterium]